MDASDRFDGNGFRVARTLGPGSEEEPPEDVLLDAERSLAEAIGAGTPETVRRFLTGEFVAVTSHGDRRGAAAILEGWGAYLRACGPTLQRQPERAAVEDDGSLGVATGRYWIEAASPEGEPLCLTGAYATTWRRSGTGEWTVLFDTGTEAAPAPAGDQR